MHLSIIDVNKFIQVKKIYATNLGVCKGFFFSKVLYTPENFIYYFLIKMFQRRNKYVPNTMAHNHKFVWNPAWLHKFYDTTN